MGMCEDGKAIARKLIAVVDEVSGIAPEDQTDVQRRNGGHASARLEDHGYECQQCAPVVAAAFMDGLRAAIDPSTGCTLGHLHAGPCDVPSSPPVDD